MTKVEFLQQLYNYLSALDTNERNEIIQDFEEHFSVGTELGKSEEQICAELGSPYSCAAQYIKTESQSEVHKKTCEKNQPINKTPDYDRRNVTLWKIMFVFSVMCAFVVYPICVGLILSPILIVIISVFAVAVMPSGAMIGFLVSLSVFLAAVGVFGFAVMTWLIKLSVRKGEI